MSESPVQRLIAHPLLGQFLKFGIVGGVALVAHYALLILLVEKFNVHPIAGSCAGYALGIVVSYVLNRRFTFDKKPPVGTAFAKFVAVQLVGMGLNAGIMTLALNAGMAYPVAQAVAIGLVLFWNFFGSRFLVFR